MSNDVSTQYICDMQDSLPETLENTAGTLERLSTLVQQAVRDDASRQGLLPIHWQVLAYLARANRYSDIPIAVAEYLGITRGTVSQTLAVLERKGLIAKEGDERHGKRDQYEKLFSINYLDNFDPSKVDRNSFYKKIENIK